VIPEAAKSRAARLSAELADLFTRTGYVRRCDTKRRSRDGQCYKKGYEVRFLLASDREVREARRLLCAAGLRPGKVFRKHRRFVQPVYGRATVEAFISLLPGRDQEARGFALDGRRLVRRTRTASVAGRRGLLPNNAPQPAAGTRGTRLRRVRSRSARG
jgi:hypothetical protein